MKTVVIDSSALVALAIPNDADHQKAVALSQRLKESDTPILLPGEVLSETLNLLGKMQGRAFASAIGDQLLTDPSIHLAALDNERFRVALTKWEKQTSGVSYTDCVVMAAADETEKKAGEKPAIFGFDAVFAKNGYRLPVVPKEREAA